MTTPTLYDALEICLQALEQGVDIESCLGRFPTLADELRPILETAAQARSAAIAEVPAAAMRRGRAKVLQAAAEMREKATAPRKSWVLGRAFRLALASLAMVIFLLTGGTGLVRASSGTVPGDNLYPVKRSWEDVQLFLAIDPKSKAELEDEFEHERVQEINTLFAEKRMEQVNFQGMVETQEPGVWQIANLRIAVDEETQFYGQIMPGAFVTVVGETDDGIIKAEKITLLATPSADFTPLPSATGLAPTLRPTEAETEEPEVTETAEATETPEVTEPADGGETPSVGETPEPTEKPSLEPTEKATEKSKEDKPKSGDDDNSGDDGSED